MRLVTALVCTVAALACDPTVPAPLDVNSPPVARALFPQLAAAGEPMIVDATLSDDPDSDALRFRVVWGDGTPEATDEDGILEHVFGAPGTFGVALTVLDVDGIPATLQESIVVVGDGDASCSCELGCFDDAVCTERGCLLYRSSVDDEEIPFGTFDDAISCP